MTLHRDGSGRLHCFDGPALQYSDGWSLYALHGVRVPPLVVLHPDQLTAQHVIHEPNAEVRRVMVERMGIERLCRETHAQVIDRGLDHAGQPCELLLLDLGDGRRRPYVKMRNPSIGVYHIEGRPPETRTVAEALRAQQPRALRALPIREDGAPWYQQGDVFVWPRSATAIRPHPEQLT